MSITPPDVSNPPIKVNIPSNVPVSYLAVISSTAGVIAFGVMPVVHRIFPEIPTLDVTVVQAALGILISVAIVVHNHGWQAASKLFLIQILPQIIKAVEDSVANQMQNNNNVGSLSVEDVVAIKHARYSRAMHPKK